MSSSTLNSLVALWMTESLQRGIHHDGLGGLLFAFQGTFPRFTTTGHASSAQIQSVSSNEAHVNSVNSTLLSRLAHHLH